MTASESTPRRTRELPTEVPSVHESPSSAEIERELRRSPENRWSGSDTETAVVPENIP